MPWHFPSQPPPTGWNAEKQLQEAGFEKKADLLATDDWLAQRPTYPVLDIPNDVYRPLVSAAGDGVALELDWKHVEDIIFNAIMTYLGDFSSRHQDDVFYGFSLECGGTHLGLNGYFNTTKPLRGRTFTYPLEHPRQLTGWTVEQLEAQAKWANRDWGDCEDFNPLDYDESYATLANTAVDWWNSTSCKQVKNDRMQALTDRFAILTCCVAIRLESVNAFRSLNTTSGFRILCLNSRETLLVAEQRLQAVRKSMNGK